jgi:hypothetical protein
MTVQITENVLEAFAIVVTDLLVLIVQSHHVNLPVIIKEYVKKEDYVNVFQVTRESSVMKNIVLMIVMITEFVFSYVLLIR